MARPKAVIDEQKLKALMRLKPSLKDTAAFFEVSDRTIERFIETTFKTGFMEFREQHMVHTRLNIVRKAVEKAQSGDNTMLIFCLKNLCDWRDRDDAKFFYEGRYISGDQLINLLVNEITRLREGKV